MSKPRSELPEFPAQLLLTIIGELKKRTFAFFYDPSTPRHLTPYFAVPLFPRRPAAYRVTDAETTDITVCRYTVADRRGDELLWVPDQPGWPRIWVAA